MKKLLLVLLTVAFPVMVNAQGKIYNNNARIVSDAGSYWVIGSGSFTLTSQNATNPALMANNTNPANSNSFRAMQDYNELTNQNTAKGSNS